MVDLDFGRLVPAFFLALMLSYSPRFFIVLALPFFARPIIGRQFVTCSLDAARTSTVAFFSGWLVFLDRHRGVSETDQFYLVALLGKDGEFFRAAGRAFWLVIATELFSSVFYAHSFSWFLGFFQIGRTGALDRSPYTAHNSLPVSRRHQKFFLRVL